MSERGRTDTLDKTRTLGNGKAITNTTGPLIIYWLFCAIVSWLVVRDEIFVWRVPQAWSNYALLGIATLILTLLAQVGYMMVARSDGRPITPVSAAIFIIVNGLLEAFLFFSVYTIFFNAAKLVFGNFDFANVFFGVLGFFLYSGLIHAGFWARLIPKHFSADPKLQPLRHWLTPLQTMIVLAWCIYYYYTGDIWTIVVYHVIVDGVLMLWVRPPILFAAIKKKA